MAVYHTAPGRWFDNAALDGFVSTLDTHTQENVARAVAGLGDPGPYMLFALVIAGVALARRTPRRAAAAVTLMAGAAVTTQLLKPALAQARFDGSLVGFDQVVDPVIGAPAFPSGHATAAMSIALAALLVSTRAWRPLTAAAGALFALGVGFAIVALGWHYPSDIVGGYLVATAWCLVTLAGLRLADARWPEPGTMRSAARTAAPAAIAPAAALAAAGAAGVGLARLERVVGFAGAHTVATVAAIGISLCAAALVAAVSMADPRPR